MAFERFAELQYKRKQRNLEYVGLIAFQGFFATSFFRIVNPVLAALCVLSAGGLAWTLAGYREQRRTLPFISRPRIVADAVESLLLMLLLVVSGLVALQFRLSLVAYQSYVCISLLAFFAGSFVSELRWVKIYFSRLDEEMQKNYVINLNRSIIFPYNIAYLRRVFGTKTKRR